MPERGGKVSIVVLVRKTKMPRKTLLGVLLCGLIVVVGFQRPDHPVRRVGMVIGIKPEKISAYKALHADSNSGVRDLLSKYHMRNFSIFLRELDNGRHYL